MGIIAFAKPSYICVRVMFFVASSPKFNAKFLMLFAKFCSLNSMPVSRLSTNVVPTFVFFFSNCQ